MDASQPPEKVLLGPAATIENIETEMEAFFRDHGHAPPQLAIDMSNCTFVEVTALMWLLSLLSAREHGGLRTTVKLPKKKDVRDFLRIWAFPRAVRDATGRSWGYFLHPDDGAILSRDEAEPAEKARYAGRILHVDGVEQRLLSEGFFEFTTFLPTISAAPMRLAERENARWREDRILSVLNNQLTKRGTTVSSHVIHEAMMNSLRHPRP